MKNKLLISCFMIIATLVFISCEQTIEMDLGEYKQRIVVSGTIEADSIPVIYLGKSKSYYDYNDGNDSIDFSFANSSVVIISDGSIADTLAFDNLMANGQYIYEGKYPVKAGKTYNLTVHAAGETITSSTFIPTPVQIDSITIIPGKTEYHIFGGDTLGSWTEMPMARVYFVDQPDIKNFYQLKYRFIDTLGGSWGYYQTYGAGDENFNGKPMHLEEYIDYYGSGSVAPGDSIDMFIQLYTVDPAFKDYRESLNMQGYGGDPFTEPSIVKSNINGGLGVFFGNALSAAYKVRVPYPF